MIQFGLNLDPISAWPIRDRAIDLSVALLNKLILHYHVLAMLHNSIIWNAFVWTCHEGQSHCMMSLLFWVFVLSCIPFAWMKSKSLSAKPGQIHFQLSLVLISVQDPSYYILHQWPFLQQGGMTMMKCCGSRFLIYIILSCTGALTSAPTPWILSIFFTYNFFGLSLFAHPRVFSIIRPNTGIEHDCQC